MVEHEAQKCRLFGLNPFSFVLGFLRVICILIGCFDDLTACELSSAIRVLNRERDKRTLKSESCKIIAALIMFNSFCS